MSEKKKFNINACLRFYFTRILKIGKEPVIKNVLPAPKQGRGANFPWVSSTFAILQEKIMTPFVVDIYTVNSLVRYSISFERKIQVYVLSSIIKIMSLSRAKVGLLPIIKDLFPLADNSLLLCTHPHLAGLFTGASWTVGGLSGSCMGSVPATRPWRQGVCFVIS